MKDLNAYDVAPLNDTEMSEINGGWGGSWFRRIFLAFIKKWLEPIKYVVF